MTQPNPAAPVVETDETDETGQAVITAPAATPPADEPPAGADALGDKGKQALDRMKAERNAARQQLAAYSGLGLDPAALKELISKSEEAEKAAEQTRTRREVESAALTKANERLIRAEIKAAATGKLANPALALKLLDMSAFEVDDDGEVDSAAIIAALDDLVKNEPYLGAAQSPPKRFEGTGDGGPKGSPGKPQLTESDVKKLYKQGKHAEIEAARKDGRLNTLLGIS